MKKFLQKSGAWIAVLVAMFAMSGTAMAQDVEFNLRNQSGKTLTSDGVTVTFNNYTQGADIWNTYDSYSVLLESETPIVRVEFEGSEAAYGASNVVASVGDFSFNLYGTSTWTGSATSIRFKGTGEGTDFYVTDLRVWLEETGPVAPVTYTVNFTGDVPAGCSASYGDDTFISNDSFEVAKNLKKDALNITTTADYYADVDYNEGSHTWTVEFKHYYYYNFVIEGSDEGYIRELGEWRSYYDGGSLKVKTALPENDFEAVDVNGYDKSEVSFETVDAYTTNVKVTYTEKAAQTYYVTFPENAPAGVSVKVYVDYYNPLTFNETSNFQTNLDLDGGYFDVTTPATHWCESVWNCYDEDTHTFTVKLHEYDKYYVAVEGTTDAAAGVVYNGTTYHVGDVIYTSYELYENSVSVASVAGLEGTVSLAGNTFTVTYKKPSYIVIETSGNSWSNNQSINIVQDGITVTGTAYSKCLNMYKNQPTKIVSSVGAIEKIEIVAGSTITSLNCTSGSFDKDTQTWTAADNQTNEVTLTVNGWDDWYVTKFKVYIIVPEPVDPSTLDRFDYLKVSPAVGEVTEISRYITVYAGDTDWVNGGIEEGEKFTTTINTGDGDELPAGVTFTDADNNSYTISNFYLGGQQINITLENNITTPGTYTLHIPAALGVTESNKTNDEWTFTWTVLDPVVGHLAMSAAGYATLCVDYAYTLPEGYTAYAAGKDVDGVATLLNEDGTIALTPLYSVAAGTPVIIEGPEAADVELLRPSYSPSAPEVNFLAGNTTDSEMTFTVENWLAYSTPGLGYDVYGDDAQLYQLAKENDLVGFYRQVEDGSTLQCAAHKAFLVVPNAVAASNARLLFPGQTITGINTVATEGVEKIYNLQGQRVLNAKSGVYVKNGKKVIVK